MSGVKFLLNLRIHEYITLEYKNNFCMRARIFQEFCTFKICRLCLFYKNNFGIILQLKWYFQHKYKCFISDFVSNL